MKRKSFLVLVLLCTCLVGCGTASQNGISKEEYESIVAERDALQERVIYLENELADSGENAISASVTEAKTATTIKEEKFDIEVLAEYTLPDGIGWFTRHFMVVKNNSNTTVDISTSSLAYSTDGTMVGASDSEFKALGAGCVSVLYEAFEVDTGIDYYETDLKAMPSKYYESAIQDLSVVQNDIDGGAVFQVTNNGIDAAEYVEGYALFFKGEDLVGYESTYFTDDDSEIKPGQTISKQMSEYENFDRIEFYLTGRK